MIGVLTVKYPISDTIIPQDKRAEINHKILHIVDTGIDCGITHTDVFQAYTGDGGLHGLQFSDYDNYHEYSEAKRDIEQGQFFTPHQLSKYLVDCIRPTQQDLIADLTCGMGNFFNYLPNESNVYGNELDIKAYKVAKYLYPQVHIENHDIRHYKPSERFDIVLGNPPFNLKWTVGSDEYLSQLYYCIKSAELLRPGGIMALIVPNSFLADQFMDGGMIREMDELFNFIVQFDLPVDSFRQFGNPHVETKMMIFQRQSEHIEHRRYTTDKIESGQSAEYVYDNYIAPVMDEKERIKHKLFFENIHANREDQEFAARVKKLLFDIKRNPLISDKHARAMDYVNQYYTQVKPDDMKYEEWQMKRITKAKVLSYLSRIVRNQHEIQQDKIRLVQTKYGLKLKAYSNKTKRQLTKITSQKAATFSDMILDDYYPFEDTTYINLYRRKVKEYKQQQPKLKSLPSVPEIDTYLDSFILSDQSTGEVLKLNPMQRADLGRVLQKRYSILNWQQGSGKTLAGIAWYKWLLKNKRVRNVFVVSAALAINMTWKVKLDDYGENFTVIKSISDIDNIKPGQVVLITLNMLIKYQRHIKKFVKRQSQKVGLIVDESDELTNHLSKRTRATLSCFRRVKYKLLTTGTTTRNNINELYPQLELLYNNSVNMLCEAPYEYKINREGDIEESDNDYYQCPFPAYYGQSAFKRSFCPAKATVFGIKKFNQDIYNREALESIIEKTILTRTFTEIVGEKKYDVVTHRIEQNTAEQEAYLKIMREFQTMIHYFRSTGNYRKDAMLRLIRQIQLMIKSTSSPHMFKEYTSKELPNKYSHIIDMVNRYDEKIAIGTVFLDTAEEYQRVLSETFPNRPVYLIKGDVVFKRRSDVIRQFEASTNGILISTQQSLKSSVNIPSCNRVVIESMQWNVPKISQYYFRFIRYNSIEKTQIHFVTYNHTIEQNLLALLMTKERINEYIKTLDFQDEVDIFDEYGIDVDILNSIIEKELDEDGHIYLTWGQQKIV